MTNRLPLIVNAGAGQIEELAALDNLSLGNSSIVDANVVSATYLYGDGSNITNLPAGDYSNANVANYLPTYTGNLTSLTGNVTTTANISGNFIIGDGSQLTNLPAGDYSNANVDSYLAGSAGNIIPVGNNAQSLGNATNQWSDLWVSNSTIYMNSVPITLGAGNVLTVNGEALLSNDSDTSITTTGNITAGNVTVADNSLTWPNASIVQTSASDFSITGDGQVTVRSLDGTYQWTFDDAGSLTAPGNVSTLANISANYFIGDGSQLTNLPVQPGTYSNADVANYLPTYSGNLTSLTGDVTTSANVQANYFIGNGSQLTDIVSSYGDSNVANYLPTYTGNLDSLTGNITTTANISGNFIIGDGSQLTNLPAQPGTYSNANVANYLPTYSGNLDSLTGNVTTTANVSGNYFIGNGSQLTNLPVQPGTYSNANVANYLPTYSGNLTSLTGNITTIANVSGNYFIGNGSELTNVVDSLVQPNNLLYVAKNGNDSTGTGSINAPYLTIQAAINAAAGDTATTIILAPGSYVENLTIANVANSLNITGSGLSESTVNGNITISGTSNNIEFDNFRVGTGRVTHSADGYWSVLNMRFSANTGITKTSNSIIKIFNTDLGGAGTGNLLLQAGRTNIYGSQVFNAQISGANTEVNFLHCDTVIIPTVISGNVNFVDSVILSTGTGNSLNALGGYVVLKNCLSITPTRVYAPINFGAGSSFSYGDSGFDFANTTFAGTAIVQPGQFQAINVRGGNVTTTANVNGNNITATGNVTANVVTAQQQLVLPTYANTTAANTAIGLANLVAGSTIFTTDSPPTFYGWDGTAWVALS